MGVPHSILWSADFTDDVGGTGPADLARDRDLAHDTSHVRDLPESPAAAEVELGARARRPAARDKAIIGVFDEGCMGMYNAIIDDELLNPLGIYKERLSPERAGGRDGAGSATTRRRRSGLAGQGAG